MIFTLKEEGYAKDKDIYIYIIYYIYEIRVMTIDSSDLVQR